MAQVSELVILISVIIHTISGAGVCVFLKWYNNKATENVMVFILNVSEQNYTWRCINNLPKPALHTPLKT